MKILVLNPQINAQHKVSVALRARGDSVLFAIDADDAMQVLALHGMTIDLALIHREAISGADSTPGTTLVKKIKADALHADLAIIFSSSQWGENEFAVHQNSPEGVNAYLKFPFGETEIIQLINEVFGVATPPSQLTGLVSTPSQLNINAPAPFVPSAPPLHEIELSAESDTGSSANIPALEGFHLEDAVPIFQNPLAKESEGFKISLENPGLSAEAPAPENALPSLQTNEDAPAFEITPPSMVLPAGLELTTPEEAKALEAAQAIQEVPGAQEVPEVQPVQDSPASLDAPAPDEFVEEMPYLSKERAPRDPLQLVRPIGDSIVPGGAASSPDAETIKKYLYLREQDVAILSSQLKASQEQIGNLDQTIREARAQIVELTHIAQEQKKRIEDFEQEKEADRLSLEKEAAELRFQLKTKTDKARILENQVKDATQEIERLKERVRSDIRKIRAREKELENKLEILKKDSEVLLGARDSKIIELKRKLDLLEFNMDLLQDQYVREKENSAKLREVFAKAAQVVRVAGGILDTSGVSPADLGSDLDQKSGLKDNKKEAS